MVLLGMLLALLPCLAAFTAQALAAPSQQEVEQKLDRVHRQIQASRRKIEEHRGEAGALQSELRTFERRIGQLNRQLGDTQAVLKNLRHRIRSLESRQKGLQKQLSQHRKVLHSQMRSEYLYAGQEKLKLLLNQQEPATLGRSLVYYDYLHRARMNEIKAVGEVLHELGQVRDEIEIQQASVVQTQSELSEHKQGLGQEQAKRKQVLKRMRARVSDEQARLASLETDRKQLQELLDKLQAALMNIPHIDQGKDFRKEKGKLFWPVVGKPSNRFGQRRKFSRRALYWQGVFIPGRAGNDVYNIFHGRVVFAEWMRGLGLLVIIDHGNGYMSLYGHNQSLYKHPGEWVKAGERIASVGNSGGQSRTGLYFEIRRHGKPVNPKLWCKKPAPSGRTG